MTDWTSPMMIARVFDVSKVVALFSGGAVFYHEVTSLSFDWSIITGQRARRWPQIFYFGIKAVWWIYFFLNVGMVYSIKKPGDCRILMDTVEVCMGLIVTFASALLAVRTCVVYTPGRERKIVSAVLIFGVLVVLGFWLGGAGDVKMAWVPQGGNPWQEGLCVYASVEQRYSAKYLVTVVFDLLVLILTINGVVRMQGGSRLGSVLMSQGVAYFAMAAAAYLVVTILCFMQLSPIMSLIGSIPSSAVAVIASTKLYQDLAYAARPQKGSQGGNYVDSSQVSGGTGEKIASYFRRSKFTDSSPMRNTTPLPYTHDGKESSSDLESQSGRSQTGTRHNRSVSNVTEQTFGRQHPYASPVKYAASGLPVVPSDVYDSNPRAVAQDHSDNAVTSGQRLAIAVERNCEIKNEVVPSENNFMQRIQGAEPYLGLKRQSG